MARNSEQRAPGDLTDPQGGQEGAPENTGATPDPQATLEGSQGTSPQEGASTDPREGDDTDSNPPETEEKENAMANATEREIEKRAAKRGAEPEPLVKVKYLEGTRTPGWTTAYRKSIAERFAERGLVEIL